MLTALAPSERYYQQRGRGHQKLTDRARQMIIQLRRWLPHRPLVLVADRTYAVLELLHFCQSLVHPVTFITRLRLDAALFEPAPPRSPTFSDAIALVRKVLWPASATFCLSASQTDMQKVPMSLFNRLVDTLCYAA